MNTPGCPDSHPAESGIGAAVLREVARMLRALSVDPTFADAIDLHSLPMTGADREQLQQRLGRGEIEVALDVAGPSRISETAYAGAWWVRHADADGRALLEQIVVARVPALLLAHPSDIFHASERLATELETPTCQESLHE